MENNFETALVKELCIVCTKEQAGAIVMNQKLTPKAAADVKAMHNKVVGFAEKPCEECAKNMEVAFMFVGFDPDKSDMENLPYGFYRTGHIIGTKKDIPLVTELVKDVDPKAIDKGYIFMEIQAMKDLNLVQDD